MVDLESLEQRWFDHWLKGIDNGIADEPPLRLFIMGINQVARRTRMAACENPMAKWHLHSGGSANTLLGNGALSTASPEDESPDRYTYDPRYPVPTMGGNNCCSPHIVPWGPYDQRPVEMRNDVLCYTSDPLETALEVTGPIQSRHLRRHRLHRHGLDRQARRCIAHRVCHEPL